MYSGGGGLNCRDTLSFEAACWNLACLSTICQAGGAAGSRSNYSAVPGAREMPASKVVVTALKISV